MAEKAGRWSVMSRPVTQEQWKAKIITSWQKAVTSIIETGKILIEAKKSLKHGEWLKLFEDKQPFSEDTAQRLMAIARHPILSNTSYRRYLPPAWRTLYELTRIPQITLQKKIDAGEITPELMQVEAIALYESTIEKLKPAPPYPSRPIPDRPDPHPNPPEPEVVYGPEHYVETTETLAASLEDSVKRWQDNFFQRAASAMSFPAEDWSKFQGKATEDMIKEAQLVIDTWTRVKEYLQELAS